jgi:hypothetical protein
MSYYRLFLYSAALAAFCVFVPATHAAENRILTLETELQIAVTRGDYAQMARIKAELEPLFVARQSTRDEERNGGALDQGGETCANATLISALPYCDFGTTLGYANDYLSSGCNGNGPDVVYRFVAAVTQEMTISLCGSNYDAVVHVWQGCPAAGGVEIACNDDLCGLQSCVTTAFTADNEYFVIVDGFQGAAGAYRLNIYAPGLGCIGTTCGSQNDDCEEATAVVTPALIHGSTIGATEDFDVANSNCNPPDGPGVWYRFPGQDSVVNVTLSNATAFHQVYFFCGCCTDLWCMWDTDCATAAGMSMALTRGVTYWLLVTGCDGEVGTFDLAVDYIAPASNGGCGDAMEQDFTAPGDASGTTCGECNWCGLRPSEDALARVNIPYDGDWVFSLCGSGFDTYLYLGTTPCSRDIYARDDTCGLQSTTPCLALAAGTYFVTIEAWASNECGAYELRVNPCPLPPPLEVVISPHFPDIHLNWVASSGAARQYKIYRSLDPENVLQPGNLIGTSATNSYVDAGVLPTATDRNYYVVTAFAP